MFNTSSCCRHTIYVDIFSFINIQKICHIYDVIGLTIYPRVELIGETEYGRLHEMLPCVINDFTCCVDR